MHPPNHNTTETSLGTSHQCEDFMWQEARNSRVARWVRTIARVAVILSVVILAAMMVMGPGEAIDWVGTYLFPVAVMLVVVIAALALLVWVVKRLPTSPLRYWYQ